MSKSRISSILVGGIVKIKYQLNPCWRYHQNQGSAESIQQNTLVESSKSRISLLSLLVELSKSRMTIILVSRTIKVKDQLKLCWWNYQIPCRCKQPHCVRIKNTFKNYFKMTVSVPLWPSPVDHVWSELWVSTVFWLPCVMDITYSYLTERCSTWRTSYLLALAENILRRHRQTSCVKHFLPLANCGTTKILMRAIRQKEYYTVICIGDCRYIPVKRK